MEVRRSGWKANAHRRARFFGLCPSICGKAVLFRPGPTIGMRFRRRRSEFRNSNPSADIVPLWGNLRTLPARPKSPSPNAGGQYLTGRNGITPTRSRKRIPSGTFLMELSKRKVPQNTWPQVPRAVRRHGNFAPKIHLSRRGEKVTMNESPEIRNFDPEMPENRSIHR